MKIAALLPLPPRGGRGEGSPVSTPAKGTPRPAGGGIKPAKPLPSTPRRPMTPFSAPGGQPAPATEKQKNTEKPFNAEQPRERSELRSLLPLPPGEGRGEGSAVSLPPPLGEGRGRGSPAALAALNVATHPTTASPHPGPPPAGEGTKQKTSPFLSSSSSSASSAPLR